jgi:carbon storage regulator CsrA
VRITTRRRSAAQRTGGQHAVRDEKSGRVGYDVRVVVDEIRGAQVRIGIEAPDQVKIYRAELTQEERGQYHVHRNGEGAGEG